MKGGGIMKWKKGSKTRRIVLVFALLAMGSGYAHAVQENASVAGAGKLLISVYSAFPQANLQFADLRISDREPLGAGGSAGNGVKIVAATSGLHERLVFADQPAGNPGNFNQLFNVDLKIPAIRDMPEKEVAGRLSAGLTAVEQAGTSGEEGVPVASRSARFEPAVMLLLGAGLIGVAEVLRRKRRIK
jgi:hypothetical protein